LTVDQVYRADQLFFNRDPFDALIVAAAQTLELPLLTRDPAIRGSGAVRVIW
jgi:PIN domain nuclease of toxin-antitoxin system